jgi:hypothetical protein
MLHLDNDTAGLTAARKIKVELAGDSRLKHICVSVDPPRGTKDYNDTLLCAVNIEKEQKRSNRLTADIFI